jgi:hypothetical protein
VVKVLDATLMRATYGPMVGSPGPQGSVRGSPTVAHSFAQGTCSEGVRDFEWLPASMYLYLYQICPSQCTGVLYYIYMNKSVCSVYLHVAVLSW